MQNFSVEEVMDNIRVEIRDKGLNIDELSYISPYHNKMIKKLKSYNELIIFGAGEYGRIIVEDLEQHGISTIQCICDNNPKVIEKEMWGYKVLTPESALLAYKDACFVITPKEYENEILSQLIHMGVTIEHILFFNVKYTGLEIE